MAIASARAGKRTLLIEADLRSPSNAHVLDAAPDPDSSLDPLKYYDPASHSIRLVPAVENLYILPHPGEQIHAAAILESSELRRTLEDAQGRFDFVILDSPALSRANDALLLEPYTDGMILVTRPDHTEEGLLTEAIEQFIESETSTVQVLGVAINGNEFDIVGPEADIDDIFPPLTLDDLAEKARVTEPHADVMVGQDHAVNLPMDDVENDHNGLDAVDLSPTTVTEVVVRQD